MHMTIAVVGTGEMGSAVGAAFARSGMRVVTDSSGRSEQSRTLAEKAGMEDLGSLPAIAEAADVVLSILPPAAAPAFSRRITETLQRTGARPLFADCNAVSPTTVSEIAAPFIALGASFADVGIVGPAPRRDANAPTRLYVSGSARARLLALEVPEIAWVDMGPEIGHASAIKMCYAGLNKGLDGLLASVLLAAERLGVRDALVEEIASSQPEASARAAKRVPYLAATAERYAPEMREIASTFAAAGVTPEFHRGAEWLYSLLARTPLAEETRLTARPGRSLDEALAAFVEALPRAPGG